MTLSWQKYVFNFKRPSGTSRGVLTQKTSYFIYIQENEAIGIGECGLLKGLSIDDTPDYEQQLSTLCNTLSNQEDIKAAIGTLQHFPSIKAGLEMAMLDLETGGKRVLYPSKFTLGEKSQPINGLIWMGDIDFMLQELQKRLEEGFTCLKMKIGAIAFEAELDILRRIRQQFTAEEIVLRVDANGAFKPDEALEKLKLLSDFELHSIEQPIQPGQWETMAMLCEHSPIPIALDEELIGLHDPAKQIKMMAEISPQYIILKPSLIGGFASSESWIELANQYNSGWWVTSALEGNIGLNAIAQWAFTLNNPLPKGLGTGSLYTNNFPAPLYVQNGQIGYDPEKHWDLSKIDLYVN